MIEKVKIQIRFTYASLSALVLEKSQPDSFRFASLTEAEVIPSPLLFRYSLSIFEFPFFYHNCLCFLAFLIPRKMIFFDRSEIFYYNLFVHFQGTNPIEYLVEFTWLLTSHLNTLPPYLALLLSVSLSIYLQKLHNPWLTSRLRPPAQSLNNKTKMLLHDWSMTDHVTKMQSSDWLVPAYGAITVFSFPLSFSPPRFNVSSLSSHLTSYLWQYYIISLSRSRTSKSHVLWLC